MDESGWVSAHIFYQDRLDSVLIHMVDPLVRELTAAGLIDGFFFLRYWDGGDHVRLRLRGPGRQQLIRERVTARCREFFRRRPAPDRYSTTDYQRWAAELARAERITDYRREPYPNNSLAFVDYRREHDWYGHGAMIEAVEGHFAESSTIALALVRAGLSTNRRDTVAMALAFLSWFAGPLSVADVAGALRSLPARPEHEASYRRQRAQVHALAERMRTLARAPYAPGAGPVAAWAESVARLRDALVDQVEPLRVARILDRCAHLTANRLGVPIAEERHLRHLAGEAVRTMARTPDERAG